MPVSEIVTTDDGYILAHWACDQDSYVQGISLPIRTSYYYNGSEDYQIRRGFAYFDTSGIPSGATILEMELTLYTLDTPEAFARDNVGTYITDLNEWPYDGPYELWYAIWNEGSAGAYIEPDWHTAGLHTGSLGANAISDFSDHPTWFAVGIAIDETSAPGELDFDSINDGFSHTHPTLTVRYHENKRRSWVIVSG